LKEAGRRCYSSGMSRREAMRLAARSGTMECPVCRQKKLLVLHHIRGRDVSGWDRPWNEAWVCAGCHDEVHAGKVVVEGWVMTTEGHILAWRRAGEAQELMEAAEPPLYSPRGPEAV